MKPLPQPKEQTYPLFQKFSCATFHSSLLSLDCPQETSDVLPINTDQLMFSSVYTSGSYSMYSFISLLLLSIIWRFTQVSVCISHLFLFADKYISLYIQYIYHSLIDVPLHFWLLQVKLLWIFVCKKKSYKS